MLEAYPNVTVEEILFEIVDSSRDGFSSNIFQEIFPTEQKGQILSDTYDFFKEEFWKLWLEHPDPHMRNYMITERWKLWLIDFWQKDWQ